MDTDPADREGIVTGFPPGLFLIGAQKAGTTYLASLLDQHPEIVVSQPKEPHYFTQHRGRSIEWYRNCFPGTHDGRVLVDASPSYSAAPVHAVDALAEGTSGSRFAGVPEAIRSLSPGARFIYVMRNPVERVHSAYWHAVRQGDEHLPLMEALQADKTYLNASDYLGQIKHYLRLFPRDRFLFLRFEDLRSEPTRVARECFEFLELSSFEPADLRRGRHAGYRAGALLKLLIGARRRIPGARGLEAAVWQSLPAGFREAVRNRITRPIPPLGAEERALLSQHFAPMVDPLEELTGLDLSVWRLPGHES